MEMKLLREYIRTLLEREQASMGSSTVLINQTHINIELANDSQSMANGLMHRESLPHNSGMLFVYPDASERSFHMRNTVIPLSIAFADLDGKIKTIKDMYPYDEEGVNSDCDAAYALEVNQGFFDSNDIVVGDVINFEAEND